MLTDACGAGNLFDGEARAQKWLEMRAGAESTRFVALVPKIEVRRANAVGRPCGAMYMVCVSWYGPESLN